MVTRKILIVDDSDDNVAYVSQILRHYGYEYAVARNGAEALDLMRQDPPALVLLDIMMPKRSGAGVFKLMKEDPVLQKVPVIFVSGASMVTGVNMKTGEQRPKVSYEDDFARDFGSQLRDVLKELKPDGYVEKPIQPQMLLAKIKEFLD